jgi:hypothetical protein
LALNPLHKESVIMKKELGWTSAKGRAEAASPEFHPVPNLFAEINFAS